jgi:hypothetical protein
LRGGEERVTLGEVVYSVDLSGERSVSLGYRTKERDGVECFTINWEWVVVVIVRYVGLLRECVSNR